MNKKNQIFELIRNAFSDVPYPGDERIVGEHQSDCGRPCSECKDVKDVFIKKNWRDYLNRPYELIGYYAPRQPVSKIGRDFVPLMRPEALHFFLPVLLAAAITDSEEADVMIDSLESLAQPEGRISNLLTPQQKEAISAALNFLGYRDGA